VLCVLCFCIDSYCFVVVVVAFVLFCIVRLRVVCVVVSSALCFPCFVLFWCSFVVLAAALTVCLDSLCALLAPSMLSWLS
jgi:hypothetical protein